MTDEKDLIEKAFQQYADAFQALDPAKVLPFFHFPAMLISPEKAAVIGNPIIGYFGFSKVMKDLKRRCFTRSVAESLHVQQLSDNLAIVTGVVIRFKQCKEEHPETFLECFNLNYTMRKVDGNWKIIVGALTETTCPSISDAKTNAATNSGASGLKEQPT
ncbi:nuclear transport factor 2 family protein [Phormidesmis priestleyi ULC007]|uniref:Nuclear transport factor 2 family protein n=1 Tax=Phormidesmis priestleyi ULC007 TaxID=1920490 RepID=A0A2T1DM91_9CYAN|nr:nuclear transport factor 2 family protein [Phormidesmis priestleyi]PSB21599.1 nuclear transport factor 2 family protein [Phormidesmis priestleyi ULC007]PZO54640.1 MAG: nuclear transport factor 2 family protein [Phormidesmis priestleyi]